MRFPRSQGYDEHRTGPIQDGEVSAEKVPPDPTQNRTSQVSGKKGRQIVPTSQVRGGKSLIQIYNPACRCLTFFGFSLK